MAEAVQVIIYHSGFLEILTADRIHRVSGYPRSHRFAARQLRLQHQFVNLALAVGGLTQHYGAGNVGVIALVTRPKIKGYHLALSNHLVRSTAMGQRAAPPAG